MKILLLGKNGQLGFELQKSLPLSGEVRAIGRQDCDLSDEAAIRRLVRNNRPDVIVNAAAYTAVDQAESEPVLAQAINTRAPAVLAEEAQQLGAMLVHFSTDYVFDGHQNGAYTEAYTETDRPNPQNVYGQTKWAGELAVQGACPRHLILRTSWVVGVHGGNFAKTILRLAAERESLSIVADQFGVPTSAAFLARVTAQLIEKAIEFESGGSLYGIYHAVPRGSTTWYDYACYVIEKARRAGHPIRVSPSSIHPVTAADYPTPAKRPTHSRLDTSKLSQTLGIQLPDWQEGVDEVLDQIL
jgi:dTDP-4-dehydrorhamnose reductase